MVNIAPSILSADFSCLGEHIELVRKGGAKYLHIDVMDGMFVPNLTIGPVVIKSIRPKSDMVFDVHLMIEEPERYIKDYADAGADIITVHSEATKDLDACIKLIKDCGKKAGVSIKPKTSVDDIRGVLDKVDMVLVMSVEPGFGGQGYLDSADKKIAELKSLVRSTADLSVDGGIKLSNLEHVIKLGANTVVAGSAIFGADDIEEETKKFVELAKRAEEE